jgi:hypothetical protein
LSRLACVGQAEVLFAARLHVPAGFFQRTGDDFASRLRARPFAEDAVLTALSWVAAPRISAGISLRVD